MSDKSPSMIRLMIREALRSMLTEDDQDNKPEEPKKPDAPKEPKKDEPAEPPQQAPKEESPAELATRLGLVYTGWGKYSDKSGKPVAKTVQGHLVRLEPGEDGPMLGPSSPMADDPYSMDGPSGEPSDNGEVDTVAPKQKSVPGSGQYENPYEQPVSLGSKNGRTQKISAKDFGPETIPHPTQVVKHSAVEPKHAGMDSILQGDDEYFFSPQVQQALKTRTPGSIEPPLKNGLPIEVTIKGKRGYVDAVDAENKTMWVTFEDGTYGEFPEKKSLGDKVKGMFKKEGVLDESEASDQATQLGLKYIGFGRYIDPASGKVVAKSVNGRLVKLDAEEDPDMDHGISPEIEAHLDKIFDSARDTAYNPKGLTHKNPGWNKDMDMVKKDVPYDANGEKTVQKLLAKVGDPVRLVRWLIKKFREETPNGKQRILQYLGILKDMGVMPEVDAEGQPQKGPEAAPQEAPRRTLFDL